MNGRAYTNDGHIKAAEFIKNEWIKMGIHPYPGTDYFQYLNLDINTFPDSMHLAINGKLLVPGKDFIVTPNSGSTKGTYETFELKAKKYANPKKFIKQIVHKNYVNKILVIDNRNLASEKEKKARKECLEILQQYQGFQLAGVILLSNNKLTFGQSAVANSIPFIKIHADSSKLDHIEKVELNIKNEVLKNYETQNVSAFIKGNAQSDSVIVICAHYDHIGSMGSETYFPGANDNASGVSMLLNLSKHYADLNYTPSHSILLLAFSAEEIGLIGSEHYTRNPYFPLEQIKFVVNLDLLGSGEKGIMAVNGKLHEQQFNSLVNLNDKHQLLPIVRKRGPAANSDHYYFSQNKVPSFFLYTMGGSQAYHDIYDTPNNLSLSKYKEVFKLITLFIEEVQQNPKSF